MRDTNLRSLIKGVSYRAFGTAATISTAYLFTEDVEKSFYIGGIEVASKIILYWGHERLWDRIRWGLESKVEKMKEI